MAEATKTYGNLSSWRRHSGRSLQSENRCTGHGHGHGHGHGGACGATRNRLLAEIATDLASQVRWTVVLVVVALLLIILAAVVGLYFFLIRPTRRLMTETIGRFQSLAEALQLTAELVGESTKAQAALAQQLAQPPPPADDPEQPAAA